MYDNDTVAYGYWRNNFLSCSNKMVFIYFATPRTVSKEYVEQRSTEI